MYTLSKQNMKPQRFAPKDAKIIREHEGATPEQLLELGLSKKAYQRLLAQQESPIDILQPVRVEQLKPDNVHEPTDVQIHKKKRGRGVQMGSKSAKMIAAKYHEDF